MEHKYSNNGVPPGSRRSEEKGSSVFSVAEAYLFFVLQKEAKKAAKLQAQMVQLPGKAVPPISPSTSTHVAHPQSLHRLTSIPKQTVGTPRPGSSSTGTRPIVRVGSTVSRPESAAPKSATPTQEQAGAPANMKRGTPMEVDQHRGKKREREEGPPVVNGGAVPAVTTNGYANGVPNGLSNTNGLVQQKQPAIALNAKAGTGNIRPRPIKKQRVVCLFSFFFLSPLTHSTQSRICQDKLEMSPHMFSNNPHLKAYEDNLDPSWGKGPVLGPTTRCFHDAPLDISNLVDPERLLAVATVCMHIDCRRAASRLRHRGWPRLFPFSGLWEKTCATSHHRCIKPRLVVFNNNIFQLFLSCSDYGRFFLLINSLALHTFSSLHDTLITTRHYPNTHVLFTQIP